jgi:peptide/nickel transport system substrate-binding protein
MAARKSDDQSYRKSTYKAAWISFWTGPLKCRSISVRTASFLHRAVNMATITPDITTFWRWLNDIQLVEMNVG